MNPFLAGNGLFTTFSGEHWLMVALTVLGAIALPWTARRYLSAAHRLLVGRILSLFLAAAVILWTLVRLFRGEFDRTTDLPLDVCNLVALALPVLMWKPSIRIHEIVYYWVLVGTAQAVITPHLEDSFPHYTFLKYWVVHGGLIVAVVYFTWAMRLFPRSRSVIKAFAWLQVYTVLVFAANLLIGSNYFYVLQKPPTASLLDVLGSWPWYLIVCDILTLILFATAYLPIRLRNRLTVDAATQVASEGSLSTASLSLVGVEEHDRS
jgi:hypothetical integral membrane protein (TIGR02206 family)